MRRIAALALSAAVALSFVAPVAAADPTQPLVDPSASAEPIATPEATPPEPTAEPTTSPDPTPSENRFGIITAAVAAA